MIVSPIKTQRIEPNEIGLLTLLDQAISELNERSIIVITSKIISLCEGAVVHRNEAEKDTLVATESTAYLPREHSKYNLIFTVTNNTLIPTAGIDESNGNDYFVLWPRNPQATATIVRSYLAERFKLKEIGVIITDSTCQPMRRGTSGIAIAHAGFHGLNDYIGQKDLFGYDYKVTMSNVSGGLAAAAVVTMGEGTEQTPLALLSDLPFVRFEAAAPDATELEIMHITAAEDLFAPFLQAIDWLPGSGTATPKD